MEEKKIRSLSEHTINQIAAGEVIENPASVVKELIENAVDAGASKIEIETLAAGRGSIIIKDDGCGMGKEDLLLSIERHATSKIIDVDDLFRLATLGFRGEALASIASVAKVKIHSCAEHHQGRVLYVEGGQIVSCEDLPRRRGTTVEVTSLFFNTPARKKFQKSAHSDLLEIHKVITNAALCHPEIAFEWISEGKKEFSLHEGCDRIATLLGEEFSQNSYKIKTTLGPFCLDGALLRPHCTRPNRMGQYLFVNQRPVTSLMISKFIEEGYGTRLQANRFPLFLLYLTMPPQELDVNIHPRKKEVRFGDEKKIRDLVLLATREALEEKEKPLPLSKISFPTPQAFSLTVMPSVRREEETRPALTKKISIVATLGQYLLCQESDEEIVVIDSRRARERVFYEKMHKEAIGVQHLLFPIQVEKSLAEAAKIVQHIPLLNDLGIAIRSFGKNSFVIEAYPDIFSENEIHSLLDSLLEELSSLKLEENRKKATLLFCRSIKKKVLTLEEGAHLVEELFLCENPHLSPSGATIFCRLTPKEVEKWL